MLAAVLVGAAGCGDDPEAELSPPGTPLVAGLEVPVGTQLVGPVFVRPLIDGAVEPGSPQRSGAVAVMRVDEDPFAAWDDLAGQARDLGVPVAASGICIWRRSLPVPGSDGIPNVDSPVSAPRPDIADAVDCDAAANGRLPDGTGIRITMSLWWWAAGAEIHVEVAEGDVEGLVSPYPETDPGPAPATASEQLPDRDAPTAVDAGDPFGRENNCFETGYDRLTLPAGARLAGGGTTPGFRDFAAVLSVDDPEAVLGELRDQLDDPADENGHYDISEEPLADGTEVWTLTGGVDAGGGGCHMLSSPDGTAILVTTQSD